VALLANPKHLQWLSNKKPLNSAEVSKMSDYYISKQVWKQDNWKYSEDNGRKISKSTKFLITDKRVYYLHGPYGIGKSSLINYVLYQPTSPKILEEDIVFLFPIVEGYFPLNSNYLQEGLQAYLEKKGTFRGDVVKWINAYTTSRFVLHLHINGELEENCEDVTLLRDLLHNCRNVFVFIESHQDVGDVLERLLGDKHIEHIEILGVEMNLLHKDWEFTNYYPLYKSDRILRLKDSWCLAHFNNWTGNQPFFYNWLRWRTEIKAEKETFLDRDTLDLLILEVVEEHWHEIEGYIKKYFDSLSKKDQEIIIHTLDNEFDESLLEDRHVQLGIAVDYRDSGGHPKRTVSKLLRRYLQEPLTLILRDDEGIPVGCAFLIDRIEDQYIAVTSVRAILKLVHSDKLLPDTHYLSDSKMSITYQVKANFDFGDNLWLKNYMELDAPYEEAKLNLILEPYKEIFFLTINVKASKSIEWKFQETDLASQQVKMFARTDWPEWVDSFICKDLEIAYTKKPYERVYWNEPSVLPALLNTGDIPQLLPGSPVVSADDRVIGMVRSKQVGADGAIHIVTIPRLREAIGRFKAKLLKEP
jgi:hypothetical protein